MYRETAPIRKNRKKFPVLGPYTFILTAHDKGIDIP